MDHAYHAESTSSQVKKRGVIAILPVFIQNPDEF
jgi:hypothetical protein